LSIDSHSGLIHGTIDYTAVAHNTLYEYYPTIRLTDNRGGTDTRTLGWTVVDRNAPPQGADETVGVDGTEPYALQAQEFGFNDPGDSPGNAFAAIAIQSVPVSGALALDGVPVTLGQTIAAADIGDLTYTFPLNVLTASFAFKVKD